MYVEGGGEGNQTKAAVREGFQRFLQDIVRAARSQKVRWQIVACGPRQAAFENFLLALETHPEAFNVLLVDSEGRPPPHSEGGIPQDPSWAENSQPARRFQGQTSCHPL